MDSLNDQLSALEWKKLYLQLEGKMRHFRIRAINIRSKLAIKMAELELKVEQAEEKTSFAEKQLLTLQSAMNDSSDSETDFLRERLLELDEQCTAQSERIVVLEKKLEHETYMRNFENQALHDKALKIKDWVLGVLRKAEKEKRELEFSNRRLNYAVKSMQERLTEVLGSTPEAKHHAYTNESHVTFEETDLSPLGISQLDATKKSYSDAENCESETRMPIMPPFFMDLDRGDFDDFSLSGMTEEKKNVYETIADYSDARNKASDETDGQASSLHFALEMSLTSTTKSVDETGLAMIDNEKDARLPTNHKSSTLLLSSSTLSSPKSDSENSNSGQHTYHNFMGTFDSIRRKFRGLTDSHQKNKPLEEGPGTKSGVEKRSKPKQKMTERSRSVSKSKKSPASASSRKGSVSRGKKAESLRKGTGQDKENNMMVEQLSSSLPTGHTAWKGIRSISPPTPPLHRIPTTVELKIYEMAKTGFKISNTVAAKSQKITPLKTDFSVGKYEEIVYKIQPFAVPVFAKVEGNFISQLRPTPFSDASDSSEEDIVTPPIFSSRRPSPWQPQRLPGAKAGSCDSLAQHQRRNGSPGIARAIKRGNSQQSITSSESDYAIPPDAQGGALTPPTDLSEPEHKLIKTSKHNSVPTASRAPSSPAKRFEVDSTALKCGYLNKLNGKSRTWSKRWFVLRNGSLFYYKSPNEVMKKAQREIALDQKSMTLARDDDKSLTIRITTNERTYYLSAESSQSAIEWMSCLQTAGASFIDGWVMRTVGEHNCRTWAVVRDGVVAFYENENDQMPFDSLNLCGCKIEETQLNLFSSMTTDHVRSGSSSTYDHVILVRTKNKGHDTYLLFETSKQKMSWLQVMTSSASMSSSSSRDLPGNATEYEKLVIKVLQSGTRLRENTGSDAVWRHPVLTYSKQGIARPLTSLSSDALKTEAMKIAKSIQLFTNEILSSQASDYHMTLAQCIAQSCLTHSELRNEVYSQLIKETNRKGMEKNGEVDPAHLQSWKLLSLLIPIFLPQIDLLNFLRKHLRRNEDSRNPVGQYVIYCQRSLERATLLGDRAAPPSRAESKSVLFHNPYQHSLPLSVPVHFADGTYEVISFDCSTTVDEFSKRITKQSGLRDHHNSGFALYVDNPDPSKSIEHHRLETSVKVCDVISLWETVVRHDSAIYKTLGLPQESAGDAAKSPKFQFKRHLYAKKLLKRDNTKENYFHLHQIANTMSRDLIPFNRDLAIEMTSLMLQLACGDKSKNQTSNIDQVICKYYPARYQGKNYLKHIRERLNSRWVALEGMQSSDCVKVFLTVARKWRHCHAKLYQAQCFSDKSSKNDIWLSVGPNSLSILNYFSMDFIESLDYSQIITIGGCQDHLIVVVLSSGSSRKLLFDMNKVEMLELVLTVSEYINLSAESKQGKLCQKIQ